MYLWMLHILVYFMKKIVLFYVILLLLDHPSTNMLVQHILIITISYIMTTVSLEDMKQFRIRLYAYTNLISWNKNIWQASIQRIFYSTSDWLQFFHRNINPMDHTKRTKLFREYTFFWLQHFIYVSAIKLSYKGYPIVTEGKLSMMAFIFFLDVKD